MFHFPKELFLPEKASQLNSCFYCSCSLSALKKEHIFNASWAGSHQTKQLICDKCNGSFSEKVDRAFLIYTETVRNAWLIKDKSKNKHKISVPIIKIDDCYSLDVGGKLKMHRPLIEKEIQADGLIGYNIFYNSKKELSKWIDSPAQEALSGRALSKEEQQKIIERVQYESEGARPQEFDKVLDIRSQYRSAAHTILKCLGFFMPDWVCSEQTREVRQFARYDEGDFCLFGVEAIQHFSLTSQFVGSLGVNYNSVEIYWCSYLRMVIGVLTILDRVKRAVIIAKNYSGIDRVLYIFESTDGSGKPPLAFLADKNPEKFSLPIEIQYFLSRHRINQVFNNEISEAAINYPIDVFIAKLRETIKKINQESLKVDNNISEKYREAFLEFFTNLDKISGVSIKLEKISSKILDYDFTNLIYKLANKEHSDIEYMPYIAETLNDIVDEIR